MQEIKAVIFDIGNVLIEWQPERFYDTIIGEDRRRALFEQVDLHAMNNLVDLGQPFQETIYATAAQYPGFQDEIRIWHDRWIEMATPVIDHSVHLLRSLRRKGIPVFALTNFGKENFDLAERHYPFLGEFDQRFISGHMEKVKPDPAIYAEVEAECGLPPESLLFADDRPENIEAAEARGWQGHLFETAAGWADELVARGLMTKEEVAS